MIWIIGGTSEGRELVHRLGHCNKYIITIATEEGKEFLDSDNIFVGRLSRDEMKKFTVENNINVIVDLSHPYAKIVSENAKIISEELEIEYLRYVRSKVDNNRNAIYLTSYEECYEFLTKIEGNIFFTTGSKNIGDFEKVKRQNRFIYRILPALESIMECRRYNIRMEDIISILGPFSKNFNKIMFEEYKADYVIMKDSGTRGGTAEKIRACEELDIKAIVIGRENEDGFHSLDALEKVLKEKYL